MTTAADVTRGAVAVFARPIEPGRVKTRLARALGDGAASALYRAFLEDTLATVARVRRLDPTLWVAGDPAHASLVGLGSGVRRQAQPEADLGERMAVALAEGLARHGASLVIGTDAPTLPAALLERALDALAPPGGGPGAPWVVGPATDGGFWLLGVRAPLPRGLLDGVAWSAPTTLEQTRARLEPRLGPPHVLPPWYDVDALEDLRILRAHLRVAPSAAPATREALAANSPGPAPRPPFVR